MSKHPRMYAIANQKGGVGKTTTAVNLAAALVKLGERVLLVDMDAQGNATTGSGVDKTLIPLSVYDLLLGDQKLASVTITDTSGGYDLVPSNSDLAALNAVGNDVKDPPHGLLRQALKGAESDYDWILIDSPPALGMATLNCLVAARSVLIPVQCEYYALEGLSDLIGTMGQVGKMLGFKLHLAGVLRTMYDARSTLCRNVSEQLQAHFAERLYNSVIPRNIRLAEAPSYGLPALAYSFSSKGAQAYLEFAGEFRARANTVAQGAA